MAAPEYASALIASLRGAPQSLSNDIGLMANRGNNPVGLMPMDLSGLLFNPQVLRMPAGVPGGARPKATGPSTGVGGGPSGVADPIKFVEVKPTVLPDLPDAPDELPPLEDDPIDPLPTDVDLPEVLPIPDVPELSPSDDKPEGLTPIPDTVIVDVKPPKKDASGWGEGGESLVRGDEVIVPSLPEPVPSMPEPLPDLPVEEIPLLPEEVDLPEVLPVPDLPPVLPETDAPMLPELPAVPEELPAIDDTIDLLPEDVDLPEVLPLPEEVTAPAPQYTAPPVEVPRAPDPEPVRDPITVVDPLPDEVILPEVPEVPEVPPVDEVVLPDVPSVPDELPFIDDPIDLLPDVVDLPTIDQIPDLPVRSDNAAALTDLYQEVFDRQPDEEGFDFWLMAMNDLGYTPDMVRDAFLSSPEYQDMLARREAGSGGLLTESGG